MFVFFLIAIPVLEVFVFIEVGRAIGWPLAIAALFATSVLGVRLVHIQGRSAIERVTSAVSERRVPARGAIDSLLGLLGGVLLVIPGFVSDAFGALLLLRPIRTLTGSWIWLHYGGFVARLFVVTGRFGSGVRRGRPADVDSTAVEDDPELLGR